MTPVNLIGFGAIGSGVADWLARSDLYTLQSVIRRSGGWSAAPLTIDAAGPDALRALGCDLLKQGDLWSVGAAALIDDALRARLLETARAHRHELRLFTGWIAGPTLALAGPSTRLHIEQHAPRIAPAPGPVFEGPLRDAAARYPEMLNTATAAALAGPGIKATSVALFCSEDGGPHRIRARCEMPGQTVVTDVDFDTGPHPVTQAIIAALATRDTGLRYG